jgi:thiosulfate dehydrogenase (quinone) large subunit
MPDALNDSAQHSATMPRMFLIPLRLYVGLGFLFSGISNLAGGQSAWRDEVTSMMISGLEKDRVFDIWKSMLEHVLVPKANAVAIIILALHLVVGVMLILGSWTRFAACIAIVMNLGFVLTRGFTIIGPHSDGIFLAMGLTILVGNAGMVLGFDAWRHSTQRKTQGPFLKRFKSALRESKSSRSSRLPFALLRILFGIAFLVSARGKLLAGQEGFTEVTEFMVGQAWAESSYSFYRPFLDAVVIPNSELFAFMVTWGELAVGIALVLGLFARPAALAAIFINLNIALAAGASLIPPDADVAFVLVGIALVCLHAPGRYWGIDGQIARLRNRSKKTSPQMNT